MDKTLPARPAGGPQNSLWFVGTWFGASITTVIFSFVFMFYLAQVKTVNTVNQNFKLYTALPTSEIVTSESIDLGDARAKIIENFLKDYSSPLSNLASNFVTVADQYHLDYRLLPAIAMQESNGGKKVIQDSNNPFGYGIYGGLVIRFSSWERAIERVGKALREDYLNQGLKTPGQIMTKYTPPSVAKGGSWAIGVSTFMEELR